MIGKPLDCQVAKLFDYAISEKYIAIIWGSPVIAKELYLYDKYTYEPLAKKLISNEFDIKLCNQYIITFRSKDLIVIYEIQSKNDEISNFLSKNHKNL